MENSDLLDPMQTAPKVNAPVAHTAPLPIEKADTTKYYKITVATASMHRSDGKKLAFVHGICATDDAWDQKYLDHEIAQRNPYLSAATEDQIETYKMHMNPRKTIADQVRAEMEPQLRRELEEKIRAELAGSADAAKIAGTDINNDAKPIVGPGFVASIVGSDKVADAMSGTNASNVGTTLAALKAKIAVK